MKFLLTNKILPLAAVFCILISCKKNSVTPAFTATIDNNTYSFDSLFAWIDTSSASSGYYYINIGAKDTKENNFVYFAGISYPDKNLTGTYYFVNPLPYPFPATYKWLGGISVILTTGQNTGIFNLGGNNISNFSIDKVTGSTLQGNFSIILNPSFSNGSTDLSKSIQMAGQFNVNYHFIP